MTIFVVKACLLGCNSYHIGVSFVAYWVVICGILPAQKGHIGVENAANERPTFAKLCKKGIFSLYFQDKSDSFFATKNLYNRILITKKNS